MGPGFHGKLIAGTLSGRRANIHCSPKCAPQHDERLARWQTALATRNGSGSTSPNIGAALPLRKPWTPPGEATQPVSEIPVERLVSVDVLVVWKGRLKGLSLPKRWWKEYQRLRGYSNIMARREAKYRRRNKMW